MLLKMVKSKFVHFISGQISSITIEPIILLNAISQTIITGSQVSNSLYLSPSIYSPSVSDPFSTHGHMDLFYYPPSSGIYSCVRTVDRVMCLHNWRSPAM